MREFDLLSNQVIVVTDVLPKGLAQKAGLQIDDHIFGLNGRLVESVDDLHRLLTLLPITNRIELAILRDGKQMTVELPSA